MSETMKEITMEEFEGLLDAFESATRRDVSATMDYNACGTDHDAEVANRAEAVRCKKRKELLAWVRKNL